ncbi:hypothetical protein NUU61_001636 [Penicillium alfredii]|uniref:HNH nuclease domain-containing protein n=1 Tax=Penicillium alfredii TaxID=1506179 RepID=A0A9W9FQ23_9EURO|nr:uncharacterized protein NUU61_001636 [Penicillium alfredii]KAJ5104289.1 hypothetical protein NUU61_001636 [Penicillium alfredii]
MEKLEQYVPTSSSDRTKRVLRAFIDHLPANGRANLIRHLQSLQSNQEIHDHAESLVNGLLMPMRTLRSTPTISPRAGMEDSIENVAAHSGSSAAREARLKRDCLTRDGLKCVVTDRYDENSMDRSNTNIRTTYTECVHIISFSLATWKDEQEEFAKNVIWTNLTRYFPSIENQIRFTRESINDTCNAMTMSKALHPSFGAFDFAFEATPRRHTYTLKNYKPRLLDDLPESVTFTRHNSHFSLPSPGLLKIHATIARIFHASGAAEPIEKAIRDLGETALLAKDGSSDISAMLAATSLGVLGSRAGNIQQPGLLLNPTTKG